MNPNFELSHSRNLFISKLFLDEEMRNIDLPENIELQNIIEHKSKKKVQFVIFNDVLQIPNKDILDKCSIWYTKFELYFFRQIYVRDIQQLIQNNIAMNMDEARKKLSDPNFDENVELEIAANKILEEKKITHSLHYIFYNENDYNADY